MSPRAFLLIFTAAALACGGCTQVPIKQKPKDDGVLDLTSPSQIKVMHIFVNKWPFHAAPAHALSLNGPKLKSRDTVAIEVEPTNEAVTPVTYSFYCPQLDVKQESKKARFEFAVTSTLVTEGYVDVRITLNPSRRGDQKTFTLHFDVDSPPLHSQ